MATAAQIHDAEPDVPQIQAVRFEDGKTICEMQPGVAIGSFDLRNRGYGIGFNNITVWPSYRHRHLTSGRDTRYLTFGVDRMFQPEFAVYLREIRAAIQVALDELVLPDPIDKTCLMCDKPCAARKGTGTARRYCSRECGVKYKRGKRSETRSWAHDSYQPHGFERFTKRKGNQVTEPSGQKG